MLRNPLYDKPTLAPEMAWCLTAPNHYRSWCWPCFIISYGVTRSQWVTFLSTLEDQLVIQALLLCNVCNSCINCTFRFGEYVTSAINVSIAVFNLGEHTLLSCVSDEYRSKLSHLSYDLVHKLHGSKSNCDINIYPRIRYKSINHNLDVSQLGYIENEKRCIHHTNRVDILLLMVLAFQVTNIYHSFDTQQSFTYTGYSGLLRVILYG